MAKTTNKAVSMILGQVSSRLLKVAQDLEPDNAAKMTKAYREFLAYEVRRSRGSILDCIDKLNNA